MSRKTLRPLFALTAIFFCAASSLAQDGLGWRHVRYGALQIEVPEEFNIHRRFRPLFWFEGREVYLNFVTATNLSRGLFVWAGYHFSPCGMDYRMAEEILETSNGLNLPGIGIFDVTASQGSGPHRAIRAPYREVTARSQLSGRDYRIYFAFKPPDCNANLSFIIVGFPEGEIDNYDQVMSTIFASFRLN